MGSTSSQDAQFIQNALDTTKSLLAPMIEGLRLEGFSHLYKACNSDCPCPKCEFYPKYPSTVDCKDVQEDCICGVPWTSEVSLPTMAGLPQLNGLTKTDSIHDVSELHPIHLPHPWNKCTLDELQGGTCFLNITTVSQPVYSTLDSFDTGLYATAAYEIRTKLLARQYIWRSAGNTTAAFDYTDAPSICKDINQKSLDWALKNASPDSLRRYNAIGQKMQMGPDVGPYNVGPLWIWSSMQYNSNSDKSLVTIRSIMMKTSVDFIIGASAGFHYCKVLSPARALEWIQTDSLYARGLSLIHI